MHHSLIKRAFRRAAARRLAVQFLYGGAERKPGEVWKTDQGNWRAKNPDGAPSSFDSKEQAQSYAEGEKAGNSSEEAAAPEGGSGVADKIKSFFKKPAKAMVDAITKGGEKAQAFAFDPKARKKMTGEMASALKKSPAKVTSAIWQSVQSEAASFVEAPRMIASILKEKRKPTVKEVKTIYGVGVYVAGAALALTGPGGGIAAASVALAHSFGLHVGIKSVGAAIDELFLHYETVESAATAAGIASKLPLATGDLPGVAHLLDALKTVLASEKDQEGPPPEMQQFMDLILKHVQANLSEGISDEDMQAIMEHGVAPPAHKKD